MPDRVRSQLALAGEASRKAWGIYRDYVVHLYFPANRMTRWERTRCGPLLLLAEYVAYLTDGVAERSRDVDFDEEETEDYAKLREYKAFTERALRRIGAYNDEVAEQIELAEEFIRLENKVTSSRQVDEKSVVRLAELRPTDVRILHGMIAALCERPDSVELAELLWPVEVLADFGNDLKGYEGDVAAGRFNVYDAFVTLHGDGAPAHLRAEIDRYNAMFEQCLDRFPGPRQTELRRLGRGRLTHPVDLVDP